MISVIIPLYNKEVSIAATVTSVLQQTYTDFEILIIDDGSTDQSLDRVEKINDCRIKVVEKHNGGVSSARNLGISTSKYNYLAFLDGDDLWLPHHLQVMIDLIKKYDNPSIGGYVTTFKRIEGNPNLLSNEVEHTLSGDDFIIDDYMDFSSTPADIISSSNFMIKKNMLKDLRFDECLSYGEDVAFWYKLFQISKLVKSSTVTAYYILSSENRSDKNIVSLDRRFWKFDFKDKTVSEKKYLGKLVAIVLIDYLYKKKYKIALIVITKYYKNIIYIVRYFYLLAKKQIKT